MSTDSATTPIEAYITERVRWELIPLQGRLALVEARITNIEAGLRTANIEARLAGVCVRVPEVSR